jgi:hypothetical protein
MPKEKKDEKIVTMVNRQMKADAQHIADVGYDGNVSDLIRDILKQAIAQSQLINQTQETKND